MPPISLLIKPASCLCNMKCAYCFYADEIQNRKQGSYGFMSDTTLKNVIRKTVLRAEGVCSIAFQGGEPTLCGIDFFQNVVSYVNHYNRKNIRIEYSLQTNGYAITEEWCRFFAKHHFLIGLSVDGTPKIHDAYRRSKDGKGTYGRILQAAKLFEQYRVPYNILTVVHRDTAQDIKSIYQQYQKNRWHYLQFIACLDPLQEPRGTKSYALLPEAYGVFLIQLFELWYRDCQKGQAPYIRQFDNYLQMLHGCLPESCEQRGCCGINYVVEADGSVYPCDFFALDDYRLGNLNEHSLTQIDEARKKLHFIEKSQHYSEQCRKCPWFSLCRCGCQRNRISSGICDGNINYLCKGYKLFFEKCYDRLEELSRLAYS